ncbi:MAG: zinc-binding dehydrogenase [Actinomycetota bacterium]|nr:zinc-binding dehydrogenase [Actinomycetota bacterium]
MLGVKFLGKEKVDVIEYPDPEPGFREVVVRIKASALCRSDLNIYHDVNLDRKRKMNVIPGHEACGVVDILGDGISENEIKVGDRVAIYLGVGCGYCEYCRKGWYIFCSQRKILGFDINGGHAEFIKIPAENCLKIPEKISFIEGALSTDKFGGLYHAQKTLEVSGKDTVAIFGIGPMGQMAVLMAKALGAKVIAVDVVGSRLEFAEKEGADYIVNGKKKDVIYEINKLTNKVGADIAIDCSGNPIAQSNAIDCIKKEGSVAFIGESKVLQINPSKQFIRKQIKVIGSWYFPVWEYSEIVNLIISKNLNLEKWVTNKFKIEEAKKAYTLFDKYQAGITVFTM